MKNKKIGILYISVILSMLILKTVLAGVSLPLPTQLQLLKGESGRFKFQIQNIGKPEGVICTASLEGESFLEVEFDDEEMPVGADALKTYFGTVTVPGNYGPDTPGYNPEEEYKQTFCVQCRPETTAAGASVSIRSCALPINVKVVEERTRDNMFVKPKPKPKINPALFIGMLILVIIIAIILIHRKKKPEVKKTVSKKSKKK